MLESARIVQTLPSGRRSVDGHGDDARQPVTGGGDRPPGGDRAAGRGRSRAPALAVHASARHMHVSRRGPRPALRPRLRADRRPAAPPAGQLRREGDGDADRPAEPPHLEPADPRAAALAVADRAGLHRRGEPRVRRRADPPLRQPRRHAGRPRDGAAGRRRARAGRHPRRDARAHEPGRGRALRRAPGGPDEAARRRRRGGDVRARARAHRPELACSTCTWTRTRPTRAASPTRGRSSCSSRGNR